MLMWHWVCVVPRLCRHEELKNMLDSDKENLKLEAMKILVGVRDKEGGCVVSWVT